jgi:SAM-dependent methyltransferase
MEFQVVDKYVALAFVVGFGGLASLYLFDLYGPNHADARDRASGRWAQWWECSIADLGGFSYRKLALVSTLGLFLEMLLIRWISSEIHIFAYFKNFVLIACFLGFGLGCYLCRRKINLLAVLFPLLMLAIFVKFPWPGLRELFSLLSSYIGKTSDVQFWGVPSLTLSWFSMLRVAAAVLVVIPLFALLTLIFVPIGQLVGWHLEKAGNGIRAYSVNIVGSLAGIGLYTLLCFLYQPPVVWFSLAGLMLILLLWRIPRLRWASATVFVLCMALLSLGSEKGASVYWSPYQKLTLTPTTEVGPSAYHPGREVTYYALSTNDVWYQRVVDLSPGFVASHPYLFTKTPAEWDPYNLPYHFYSNPPAVLVLGSGMGNDVAAALRNGAGGVVAVEIDPLILELGRRFHFEKPYDSPRIRTVVNDARSYIQSSNDRFDLIVFSLLDAHTNSSYYSNIRIDNYVYTIEALQAAKRLLTPGGVFVVKFQVDTTWIAGRLRGLLESVFGHPPLQVQGGYDHGTGGRFFVTGSEQKIAQAMRDPELSAYVANNNNFVTESATLTTDDWPYFYQHEPGLPGGVMLISALLFLLCWILMRRTGIKAGSIRWHFFFLGAGFLLLEAQIISKMALLFGTTWVVNSIVISALLLLIVGSNVLVERKPGIPLPLAYAGIFAAMIVSFAVPLERLFFASIWLKAVAATVVLCLPVFFAGVIFIQSFARSGFSGEALGSNLLGALAGGLLESLSMWTGLKSLLVLAAMLYLASSISLWGERSTVESTLQSVGSQMDG